MLPNVLQPKEADHVPVLAEEVQECLAVRPGETVIDATFGAGGHAAILAGDLRGKGKLIAIDRDPTARTYFEQLTKRATVNARLLRGDFGVVLPQLAENGVRADAILLDLGVSSMQLDRPERGFSYAADAPLDMRMGPEGTSAAVLVNELDADALEEVLRDFGEEPMARRISRAIVSAREEAPIETTSQLAEIVRRVKKARAGEIKEFTGIDAPYEPPEDAEIVVHTDKQTVDESLATILEQLLPRLKPEELE